MFSSVYIQSACLSLVSAFPVWRLREEEGLQDFFLNEFLFSVGAESLLSWCPSRRHGEKTARSVPLVSASAERQLRLQPKNHRYTDCWKHGRV